MRRSRRLIRFGHWSVMYRISRWAPLAAALAVAAVLTASVVAGLVAIGSVAAGVVLLAWLTFALRLTRYVPAGPSAPSGGDGPAPPGGAGVREPRRPLPFAPAGAAALPLPDDEDPRHGIAAIA